jgi:hypothetical protein
MASVLKAQIKVASKMESKMPKEKRKRVEKDGDIEMADAATAEEPPKKKRNKQRVLLLCSRGVTHRMRHLVNDLEALLPHVKKGQSMMQRRERSPIDTLQFRLQIGFKEQSRTPSRTRRFA